MTEYRAMAARIPSAGSAGDNAARKKHGADCGMIVWDGMFHCYPVFPVCREDKEGWKLMIRLPKENTR